MTYTYILTRAPQYAHNTRMQRLRPSQGGKFLGPVEPAVDTTALTAVDAQGELNKHPLFDTVEGQPLLRAWFRLFPNRVADGLALAKDLEKYG